MDLSVRDWCLVGMIDAKSVVAAAECVCAVRTRGEGIEWYCGDTE